MFYASYARGFKAGGLDALPPQNSLSDFGPETVNAFEAGAKVSGLDNRLRFSIALFWSNFSGLQQSVYSTPSDPTKVGLFTTQNVGKAVSRGIELDGSFAITSGLKLAGALTILDAYFKDFPNGPCSTAYAATHPGCITRNFEGLKQPFAPDYSGSASITYERDVFSSLRFTASATLTFTDGYFTEVKLDPFSYQKAYQKLDARLGIGDRDGRWHAAVIGKNLTNEYTTQWGSDTSLATGTYFRMLDRTRSVAVQVGFSY
jgi:outer membrane receptor protein involved in Fe transport